MSQESSDKLGRSIKERLMEQLPAEPHPTKDGWVCIPAIHADAIADLCTDAFNHIEQIERNAVPECGSSDLTKRLLEPFNWHSSDAASDKALLMQEAAARIDQLERELDVMEADRDVWKSLVDVPLSASGPSEEEVRVAQMQAGCTAPGEARYILAHAVLDWQRQAGSARSTSGSIEIRTNADATLDEAILKDGKANFHLEQMSDTHWWMVLELDKQCVHIGLHSRSKIVANISDEGEAPLLTDANAVSASGKLP